MGVSVLPDDPGARTSAAAAGPAAAAPRRLDSLTSLRFLAALAVFLYHTSLGAPYLRLLGSDRQAADWHKIADPAGGLGVGFFFVLSGFVLTWSAREKDTARHFWRRRFVKIYPNYAATWLAAGLLFAFSITPAWVAAVNLGMVEVWIPKFDTSYSMDSPGWSLGVEAVFYLCFPLLLKLLLRIRPQHLKYWISGVVATLFLIPVFAYAAFPSSPRLLVGAAAEPQYFVGYIFPPLRMFDFVLGILLALAVRHGRWRNIGLAWSGLVLAGSYAIAVYAPFLLAQTAVCAIGIALVITAAATADAEGRFTPFQSRAMVWLGNVSFAFYLVHFLVLRTMRSQLGHGLYSGWSTVGIEIANFFITLAVSAALYALFERPIVRRWSSPRTARARAAEPPLIPAPRRP